MIQGILFDLNGTLIDIRTDEGCPDVYRVVSNFLKYEGILVSPEEVRDFYFDVNRRQRHASEEKYPEFDVVGLAGELLQTYGAEALATMPPQRAAMLPGILAELYRGATLFQLQLYDDVLPVLTELKKSYRLGALSDGQSIWALPELRAVGLDGFFEHVIVSSDYGFRKPEERMFKLILERMHLRPEEVLFVGNDMFRDVYGAKRMGIKSIYFKSNQGEQEYSGAEPDYIIYDFRQLLEGVRFLLEHGA